MDGQQMSTDNHNSLFGHNAWQLVSVSALEKHMHSVELLISEASWEHSSRVVQFDELFQEAFRKCDQRATIVHFFWLSWSIKCGKQCSLVVLDASEFAQTRQNNRVHSHWLLWHIGDLEEYDRYSGEFRQCKTSLFL